MPAILRLMGAALIAIGLAGYLLPAGSVHWTALIPAILGAAALLASFLRLAPPYAAGLVSLIAVLALFGGGSALAQLPPVLAGEASAATNSRAATALAALGGLAAMLLGWLRRRAG
jgi:hypothetical protein